MNETNILLTAVYNRTQRASKTLGMLLPSVENKSLRRDIITQIGEYDKINKEAGEEICSAGNQPRKNLSVKERMNVWGMSLNVSANSSCENVAKVISYDSSSGVMEIVKTMNSCVNSTPAAYNLARKLVVQEENGISKMKPYL